MNIRGSGTRQVLGTCLSALLLLGAAVPVLERADLSKTTAVESQHDPASCSPHNHTLCVQVGASHALPSRPDLRVRVSPARTPQAVIDPGTSVSTGFTVGHPSRAPPLA